MSVVYVKVKGKDEIVFPECFYKKYDNFIVIHIIDHPEHEIGAFNIAVIEYVYYNYEDNKDAREWFEKGMKISK